MHQHSTGVEEPRAYSAEATPEAAETSIDTVINDYQRGSMMWGSMRITARKHWKNFWYGNRVGSVLLWRQVRAEGFVRLLLDTLMHLPVALISISLFVLVPTRIQTVHQGGYAVGAVVFGFACANLLAALIIRLISARWILVFHALVNIPALLYLAQLSEPSAGQVTTTEYTLVCLVAGITLPPWSALSQRYRVGGAGQQSDALAIMARSNIINLSMYPLAALTVLIIVLSEGGGLGLFIVVGLDALLFVAALLIPSLLPQNFPRRKVPENMGDAQLARPSGAPPGALDGRHASALKMFLVLGTAMLGACIGSTATGLLGFSQAYDIPYLYPTTLVITAVVALVIAIPVLLGGARIVPWQGWLVSGMFLVFATMLLPVFSNIVGVMVSLGVFGLALGVSLAGQALSLSMLMGHSHDSQLSFLVQSTSAVGITLGSMWGGFLGDAPYYRNAFMVPVIAACLYLVLGHLFGYAWRQDFEEHLEPLPDTQ